MDDLFVHTLRDIYYAERQIVQALPDMSRWSHQELLSIFQMGASLSPHTRLVVKQHLRAFIGFSAMLVIAGAGVANW